MINGPWGLVNARLRLADNGRKVPDECFILKKLF